MAATGNDEVMKLLVEAHSNELALIPTLKVHAAVAESGSYKNLVLAHLRETQSHADLIARRLDHLGFTRPLPAAAYGVVQNVVKQGLVMAKGPVDMMRGRTNVAEKMMRNARDEAMTEALEIATYDALESVALVAGDSETADLAATIRSDEEGMLESLRREIPRLADAFAQSVIANPVAGGEPWAGYDDMTVDEIREQLDEVSEALALRVRDHERKNKNRKTVIDLTEHERIST